MEGIKGALLRMVKAGRLAKELDESMVKNGFSDSPYIRIYGEITQAILLMINEPKEIDFDETVTYLALETPILTNERRAEILFEEYLKNNHPKPQTMSKEDMRKLYQTNGGYMTPEGDWK